MFFLLTLLSCAVSAGQDLSASGRGPGALSQAPSASETPATKKDLEKATATLRRQVQQLEKTAVLRSALAKKEADRQHDELVKASEAVAEKARVRLQLEMNKKSREEKSENDRRTASFIKAVTLSAVGIVGVILFGLWALVTKRAKLVKQTPAQNESKIPVTILAVAPGRFQINDKTDFRTLQSFVANNSHLSLIFRSRKEVEVPCILELPTKGTRYDGMKFDCTVVLKEDASSTQVIFDMAPDFRASWKNRNSRAVEIVEKKASIVREA